METPASNCSPKIYLMIENPSKSTSLGPIFRCASAFGVKIIVVVGYAQCSVDGSHGASRHLEIIPFPTAEQASQYLRDECGCTSIIGLLGAAPGDYSEDGSLVVTRNALAELSTFQEEAEIVLGTSYPIHCYDFSKTGNTCIVLSRLRAGVQLTLAQHCDAFIHVPHIPLHCETVPPPLLDIHSTLSIALFHASASLCVTERWFNGHKYDVENLAKTQRDDLDDMKSLYRLEQKQGLEEAIEHALDYNSLAALLGAGDDESS